MKLVVRKFDNVIITGCSLGKITARGIELEQDSFLQPADEFKVFEVPDDFVFEAQKQCYDGTNLSTNRSYQAPPLGPEEEVNILKQKQEIMQQAIDDLILGGAL
jgi:hypothetical protein